MEVIYSKTFLPTDHTTRCLNEDTWTWIFSVLKITCLACIFSIVKVQPDYCTFGSDLCLRKCGQCHEPNSQVPRATGVLGASGSRHIGGISKTVPLKHVAVWVFQGNGRAVCEQPTKITASVARMSTESLGKSSEVILLSHNNSKYVENGFKNSSTC
jgi:hypothetical protein